MKVCNKCNQEKPLESFSFKSKEKGTRNTTCKPCHKMYRDKHYIDNKSNYYNNVKSRRDTIRALYLEYKKSLSCLRCDFNDFKALQFDHLNDKEFNISEMINRGFTWNNILKEIQKCQVLCANCHSIKTWDERHADVA